LVNQVESQITFWEEKIFCLSTTVNTSDFCSIKFKKLFAIEIDVHFTEKSSVPSNPFISSSNPAE
jgi:hypothetical protein